MFWLCITRKTYTDTHIKMFSCLHVVSTRVSYNTLYHFISFGAGSGHIWLDNVVCAGTEMFIQDCGHNDFGENNCQHSADVGVRCLRKYIHMCRDINVQRFIA